MRTSQGSARCTTDFVAITSPFRAASSAAAMDCSIVIFAFSGPEFQLEIDRVPIASPGARACGTGYTCTA